MKITDLIISAIVKRGILYEGKNLEMELEIPVPMVYSDGERLVTKIPVKVKIESMSIRIEKE